MDAGGSSRLSVQTRSEMDAGGSSSIQSDLLEVELLIKMLKCYMSSALTLLSLSIPSENDKEYTIRSLTHREIKIEECKLAVAGLLEFFIEKIKPLDDSRGIIVYGGIGKTKPESEEKPSYYQYVPFKSGIKLMTAFGNNFKTEFLRNLLDTYGFLSIGWNYITFTVVSGNDIHHCHQIRLDTIKLRRGEETQVTYLASTILKNFDRLFGELLSRCGMSGTNLIGFIISSPFSINWSPFLKGISEAKERMDRQVSGNVICLEWTKKFDNILRVCDDYYGGKQSFDKALDQSVENLTNVGAGVEKKMLERIIGFVARNEYKRCVVTLERTLELLELNALEVIFVWNKIDHMAYTVVDAATKGTKIVYKDSKEKVHFSSPEVLVSGELLIERILTVSKAKNAQLVMFNNDHKYGVMFYAIIGIIGGIISESCQMPMNVKEAISVANEEAKDLLSQHEEETLL